MFRLKSNFIFRIYSFLNSVGDDTIFDLGGEFGYNSLFILVLGN